MDDSVTARRPGSVAAEQPQPLYLKYIVLIKLWGLTCWLWFGFLVFLLILQSDLDAGLLGCLDMHLECFPLGSHSVSEMHHCYCSINTCIVTIAKTHYWSIILPVSCTHVKKYIWPITWNRNAKFRCSFTWRVLWRWSEGNVGKEVRDQFLVAKTFTPTTEVYI